MEQPEGTKFETGEELQLFKEIASLQQSGFDVHVGARCALELSGCAQYIRFFIDEAPVFVKSRSKTLLSYLSKNSWDIKPQVFQVSLFGENNTDFRDYEGMKISGQIRAVMECMYVYPKIVSFMEIYELMEFMDSCPKTVLSLQSLLNSCQSAKVNRLFLYFAERLGFDWAKHIDMRNIYWGKGTLNFAENGVFVSKYQIIVPESFKEEMECIF
ncbi:MAG: type IV toxin-antitoxin system AbiEi family antitoxin [Bacteroidales bacterium]|jgi:hypothetical protein|nr:type IV toxin-antitoxin system AbiEi family antitoxin [Bacteroidales bacterium]